MPAYLEEIQGSSAFEIYTCASGSFNLQQVNILQVDIPASTVGHLHAQQNKRPVIIQVDCIIQLKAVPACDAGEAVLPALAVDIFQSFIAARDFTARKAGQDSFSAWISIAEPDERISNRRRSVIMANYADPEIGRASCRERVYVLV